MTIPNQYVTFPIVDAAIIAMLEQHGGQFSQSVLIHRLSGSTGYTRGDISKGIRRLLIDGLIRAEVVSPGSTPQQTPEVRLFLNAGGVQ